MPEKRHEIHFFLGKVEYIASSVIKLDTTY